MYFLKKDQFGNHVLTKEGERLYQQIVRPPRQHGKPRQFHPPSLAASCPASRSTPCIAGRDHESTRSREHEKLRPFRRH